MIQIKYKNQGVHYLEVIHDALLIGIVEYCNRYYRFGNCDDCKHKTACDDIQRAIGYIDKMITEENGKL